MMKIITWTGFLLSLALLQESCIGLEQNDQQPELASLQQGIRTSAAIGYCASIAVSVHRGSPLPSNVTVDQSGIIHVTADELHPVPFNKGAGTILIASLWNDNGGIMSVLFSGTNPGLYGLYAVPVAIRPYEPCIRAFYMKQDIILGSGSDTIMNLSSALLDSRLSLLETGNPENAFVAVKQNFWSVDIDQNNTPSELLDDDMTLNGGGQIAEVKGESGGVIYHAMIGTVLNYSVCSKNPLSGFALTQNFKAGGEPLIDLGNSFLSFHSSCDGKVHIEFSSGKYFNYSGKDLLLGL